MFWSLIQKNCWNICLDITSLCFQSLVPCLKFTLHNIAAKKLTDVSLVLKDSNTESGKLSLLMQLSVLDGQKADSSEVVSFIGI